MSWKPQVLVQGEWSSNGCAFPTKDEAENAAADIFSRWTLCTGHRAVESTEPVNYRWDVAQGLRPISAELVPEVKP